MKIETLMTSDVRTCRANDSLSAAAQAMWEGDLGCLPVVDDSKGVVGILTDRDVLMASHLRGAPLWTIAVSEAMASVVFSVSPSDSVEDVLERMQSLQVRRLPVVSKEGELVGIVSLGQLACAVANDAAPLKPRDIAAAFAAISAPRAPAQPVVEALVIEVTRETSAPAAPALKSQTLQPAPRKAKASKPAAPKAKPAPKAPKAKAPKPAPRAKARAGK
ncbi:MAG: CBS domain-containing protein [Planctomycetota bacterium]|nr:CBS domain-containing protein [Planctomycetota bacterium]